MASLGFISKLPLWILLALSVLFEILGVYFAKYWSFEFKWGFLLLSISAWGLSGIFFMPTLLKQELSIVSIMWAVLSILGYLIIGILIFKESLSLIQIIGIVLGIISVAILSA